MKRPRAAAALLGGLAFGSGGCGRRAASEGTAKPRAEERTAPETAPSEGARVVLDMIGQRARCSLGHRGWLVDLGEPDDAARLALRELDGTEENLEREGATWVRVRGRTASFTFVNSGGEAPEGAPFVEAHVRGAAARSVAVFLGGKSLGVWPLGRGEARLVVARGGPAQLAVGTNEVLLRFSGAGARGGDDVQAEVDWIHVGAGESEAAYAAPTFADAVTSSIAGGAGKRALALRAPGFVRCAAVLPRGARVETKISLAGTGEADAELRLLRDRAPALVLARAHVSAAQAGWTTLAAALPPEAAGRLAAVELAVTSAAKGARVLFAEPRVVAPAGEPGPPRPPPARNAIIVVLGSSNARPPAGVARALDAPEVARLAARGATFEAHRATSSLASAALASMLTGLAPEAHGVRDPDARLPKGVTTLAEAARQAGVATAFFTANPTTGAAFGFDRGWDTFGAVAPAGDAPATRVFDDAAAWILQRAGNRFLVLIHARGGHPPWDVPADTLKTMAPDGYAGPVDPRHAAELLAPRGKRGGQRLTEADRVRLLALRAVAVATHDAAVGALVAAVRAAGHEGDTAFLVTSDVGTVDASPTPFAETELESGAQVSVPLVVALPGDTARKVDAPTSGLDVARTVLRALGLAAPESFEGLDVMDVAAGVPPYPRPLLASGAATTDRSGAHEELLWGPFELADARRQGAGPPRLCDTALDPACATDVSGTHPIALEAMLRAAREARGAARKTRTREPATIDAQTGAWLRAWGR